MTVSNELWIVIEQRDVEECHLELVSEARKIAEGLGGRVCCVAVQKITDEAVKELGNYGADKVYLLNSPLFSQYCAETAGLYVESLSKLIEGAMPRKVLCVDNGTGVDLACRLAARMKIGLITGCVSLSLGEDGLVAQSKPMYEGRVLSTFVCRSSPLEIATVKSGIMEKKKREATKSPEIVVVKPPIDESELKVKTIGIAKADPDKIGLDEAEIIITGGRGMGSAESFQMLDTLAKLLGGVVAGSLAAVDEGWMPRRKLVGQTGMTVEPKLYIACGVSGSIYHVLGMRDSKVIVAINKDRYASIFKYADFGIVGDVMDVIPAILNRLEKLTQNLTSDNTGTNA